jgi:1,2-dihydroxy-3-keto-5-methylthiopentene dioxygenase
MKLLTSTTIGHPITTDAPAIAEACQRAGIQAGAWDESLLTKVDGEALLERSTDTETATLQAIKKPLSDFKSTHGYKHEDIVGLTPKTPNLDTILAAFKPLHHHEDDEVRVVLYGAGIFGFTPEAGDPFELELTRGDWIIVPAYTKHYFYLTDAQNVIALRLFKDNPKWEAIYA